MAFAQARVCLSFGRSKHYDLFKMVDQWLVTARKYVWAVGIPGCLRYASLRTTGSATNAAKVEGKVIFGSASLIMTVNTKLLAVPCVFM